MISLGFYKAQPTEYVIKYVGGQLAREGTGLAFYYLDHNTQIVVVPTSTTDTHFMFNEVTNDFQTVSIQGQCTYRIAAPKQAADLLNFAIDTRYRKYLSEDPDKLAQRVTSVIQMQARAEIKRLSLEQALEGSDAIAAHVLEYIRREAVLESLGVEVQSVYIVAAKPTPEVAKALEATYRETLLRRADEAIYARRAAAVEEERKIKENELNTDIALEEHRRQLIDLQGDNAQREADYQGKALELQAEYAARASEMELAVYRTLDPRSILALAMKELGHNADRVGNLTITSEIMAALLNQPPVLNGANNHGAIAEG